MNQNLRDFTVGLVFCLAASTAWYYAYVKPADDARFPIIKCAQQLPGGPTRENFAKCSDQLHPNH
jgi:hypothetical protein